MEASQSTLLTVIEPERGLRFPNMREIWAYRDLLYFLARRDVVIRYNQAIVGFFWAILQPLFLAGIFSLFLGVLQKIPAEAYGGIPYPLFAFAGLVVWLPFADALNRGAESTVASEMLISKIYFPRILLPVAALAPAFVDFCLGFLVLIVVAFAYGYTPGLGVLAVPLIVILTMTTALGFGLWLSAVNVRYRDVHLLVPLIVLTGLFISPIFYPLDLVPQQFGHSAIVEALYGLNPMVGVLESFRWAVLGSAWPGLLLLVPVCTSILLLITGSIYFQRAERTFADVI